MNLKISDLKKLKLKYKKNGYIKIKLFKNSKIEKFKSNLAKVLLLQIKKFYQKNICILKKKI